VDVQLDVFARNPDAAISFREFHFRHAICGGLMSQHFNAATDSWSLSCGCPLLIHFPQNGVAEDLIVHTVMDGVTRNLPPNSFNSAIARTISVVRVEPFC
jgi:hypothetical protein